MAVVILGGVGPAGYEVVYLHDGRILTASVGAQEVRPVFPPTPYLLVLFIHQEELDATNACRRKFRALCNQSLIGLAGMA